MRFTTAFRAIAAAAAIALTASACSADGGGDGDTIRIGASLPLTGEFSQGGLDTQRGYETWVEMTNEAGGLLGKPVEIIVKDDATQQETAVSNYNNLIAQDKVDLLLGSQSSLLNIPASAIAEKNKMLFVCPSCGSPDMFNRGFSYIFFSQQAIATDQAKVFAEWIAALQPEQRPKTAAYPALDDPFTGPVVEGAEKILSAAGVETVYKDQYPATTKNFDSVVNAMRDAGAEIVVQGAQFEDGVNMIRSMNRANYEPSILYQSSSPTYGQQYLDAVGPQNAEGVFFSMSYSPLADTPDNAEFVKRYQDKFNQLPPRMLLTDSRPVRCWPPPSPLSVPWTTRRLWRTGCAATVLRPCWGTSAGIPTAVRGATSWSDSGRAGCRRSCCRPMWPPRTRSCAGTAETSEPVGRPSPVRSCKP